MRIGGFYLTGLTVKGPGVPDADIRFCRGLNVVFGPSNTGKTFIAQCVDFMFGGSRMPKEIPEVASYDKVCLGLSTGDNDDGFVLERSLRGGDYLLRLSGKGKRLLSAKHKADDKDTISHFLLSLSGMTDKKVRTNQQGNTRTLSFRDISKLVLVDETSVISDRSPIFSGQMQWKTAEGSVFRLMLTGIDDSSVIAKDDPKIAKGRLEGKTDVIEALLTKARAQVTEAKADAGESELREKLARLEVMVEEASKELVAEQRSVATLEGARREAWVSLRETDSRLAVLAELHSRFELLQKHYESDLRRLESISEAGFRLEQMKEERCPVCGALAEHHDVQHQSQRPSLEEVATSCNAEAKKIRTLLLDLQNTLATNKAEVESLEIKRQSKSGVLVTISEKLHESLEPRIKVTLQKLLDSQGQRDKIRRAIELSERVRELEDYLKGIGKPPKRERADGPPTTVGADEAEGFCQEVEYLLRSWHFPGLQRVTFSEEDQDIVISGQRRASHGKGVRAITHAAFNLALLKCCLSRLKPHPGLVLIDSPLIVYRQPDVGEENFTHTVKDEFYRNLAKNYTSAQVIILENDPPPKDLLSNINIIEFTGANRGRQGFIPR